MDEDAKKRGRFDAVVTGLVGRTIESVINRDLAAVYGRPRRWDYGEWHRAVMGVEFGTDRGPVSPPGPTRSGRRASKQFPDRSPH